MLQEFQSPSIQATVESRAGCMIDLKFTVEPEFVAKQYHRALRNVNKEVSFPGFRKGHAPAAVIEKRFAKEINEEWRRFIMEFGVNEAFRLIGKQPRSKESVTNFELISYSKEDGAEIKMSFEVAPTIPEIDLQAFSPNMPKLAEVGAEYTDNFIQQAHLLGLDLDEVFDRVLQEGDVARYTIELLLEGEGAKEVNKSIIVSHIVRDRLPEWLFDALIGMEKGESREVAGRSSPVLLLPGWEAPEEFRCRIELNEIRTGDVALLDEELAKSRGFADISSMRSSVKMMLEAAQRQRALYDLFEQLEEYILLNYNFDLPESQKLALQQSIIKSRIAAKEEAGISLSPQERMELIASVAEESESELRLHYITSEMAKRLGIGVSQKAFENAFAASGISPSDPKVKEKSIKLYGDLLREQVYLELLKGRHEF